jgi:hypothetical protein
MAKEIAFDTTARDSLKKGVDQLAVVSKAISFAIIIFVLC